MATRDDRVQLKRKLPRSVLLASTVLMVAACALAPNGAAPAPARADVLWLNWVTYGVNSVTLAEYKRRGRTAFLDEHLASREAPLPTVVAGKSVRLLLRTRMQRSSSPRPMPNTSA